MDNTKPSASAIPNYIAMLYQAGEGCDYSISCGTQMVPLKAETPQEAVAESTQLLAEYRDERRLRAMHIFEVSRSLVVPVDQLYREFDEAKAAEAKAKKDAKEEAEARALWKKLNARFGGEK